MAINSGGNRGGDGLARLHSEICVGCANNSERSSDGDGLTVISGGRYYLASGHKRAW